MIVDNTDDYEERRRGLAQDPAEAYHDIDIARLLVMTGDGHVVVPWTEFDLNESIIEKTFPLERFPPQEEAYELSLFTQDLDGKPLFRHRASLRMISGEESRGLAVWDRLRRSFDAPGSPDSSKAAQSDNVSSLKSIPTATAPLAQAQAWENPDNNIRPPVDVDNDGFLPAEWWREVLPSTILHTTWDHVQKTWKDGDLTNWIEDIKIQGFNTLQPGNDSSNSTVPFDADLRYHVTKAADGKIVYVLYEVDFNSDGLSFKKYWSENNLPASASYNPSSAAAKHLSTSTLTSTTLIPTPTTVSLIVGPGPVTTTTVRPRRARRQDVPAPTPTDVPGDGMSGMDSVTFIPQGKKDQIAWDAADTLRRILDDYFSPDGLTAQNDSVKSQVAWQGTQTLRHVVDAYFAEDAPALSASSPEAPSPEVQRRSPPSADAYASMIVEEDAKLVNAMAEAMASIFPDPRANVTQAQGSGRRVISPTPQDKVDVVMHFQHHLLNALHEDDDALRRALREKYMKASADASPEDWIREIMDQVHRDVLMAFEYKVRTSVAKWFGLDPVQVAMTLQSAILAPSAAAGSASQRFHRAGSKSSASLWSLW
ncbi:hypothetical protein M011DRAFT_20564 [Sporormia fimetaria CBS 119925]|uniref:Uncharacterized protein n=1 Tax=Sporormia fimetaria CBS 119925 TaxID=1340428 RepID=A0A6A6VNT9_9PLEO|nr:hypothetical protein M011DRAFT_20564 [Sporormia fimetaria CBS 119925]